MKKFYLLILFAFVLSQNIFSQNQEMDLTENQKTEVLKAARNWVQEIFKAESIDKLLQYSTLPFACDRREVITDVQGLKNMYAKIFRDKGKRNIPSCSYSVIGYKHEVIDCIIPVNTALVMVVFDGGKDVVIGISIIDGEYKISGFSD